MNKTIINKNTTFDLLDKQIVKKSNVEICKEEPFNNEYVAYSYRIMMKCIKYNKLDLLLRIFCVNDKQSPSYYHLYLGIKILLNYKNDNNNIYKYVCKYAYYYKNTHIIIAFLHLHTKILNEQPFHNINNTFERFFVEYLKNKRSSFYKKFCFEIVNNKIYNLGITSFNKSKMYILNLYCKNDGFIKIYNYCDICSNKEHNLLSFYFDKSVKCNGCVLKYDTFNVHSLYNQQLQTTYKLNVRNIFYLIYKYCNDYENKKISELDFNLLHNLLKKNCNNQSIVDNLDIITNIYQIIGIYTIIYATIYKNKNIFENIIIYLNTIEKNISLFKIILLLSSINEINVYFNDIRDLITINKCNFIIPKNNFVINIISDIVGNDIYYKNIPVTEYNNIKIILNNKNKSEIDKIIISKILETNIQNTLEFNL